MRSSSALLLLLLTLTGCLPSSCSRTESRALFPSDSLSRALAGQIPEDTLRLVWQAVGADDHPLVYPRTALFGADGSLYVSDASRNSIFIFTADGTFQHEITGETLAFPYLAGLRGDTLLVFNPEAHHIDFLVDGVSTRRVSTPDDLPARGTLLYTAATDTALFFKVLGEDFPGYLARLDARGRITEQWPLPGPAWQHAGLLRPWGDSLLSLIGFLPTIELLMPDGRLDTLTLTGFDSPMLSRTRLFVEGEIHEAPLLSAAAAPADDLLFVLNMRPGWLRIDAFDRAGRLRHRLTQSNPAFDKDYYPTDLAARPLGDGRYRLAVLLLQPEPRVDVYTWP